MIVRVIGLISGTSIDGIDAALVDITPAANSFKVDLVAAETYPYPAALREQILAVCAGLPVSMADLATLDDAIAYQFAAAALAVQTGHTSATLIGSHGQTVFHRPPNRDQSQKLDSHQYPLPGSLPNPDSLGYSLQLGRGALIAYLTRIPTVSNFRAADIAAGGQGAPLVPAVDVALLTHAVYHRCVQNIGGIGNVAYLPAGGNLSVGKLTAQNGGGDRGAGATVLGWDTGPGNVLLDLAVRQLSEGAMDYDRDGAWAASGNPCQELVSQWLQHEFFRTPPPKSTGRELFGVEYLQHCLQDTATYSLTPADTLATLTELTAASIADSYHRFLPIYPDQVLLCGGGSQNLYLKRRIQALLTDSSVLTTDEVGLSAAFKEAIAFAVLAYWRQQGIFGNLPEVTGASQTSLLGEIHQVI